MATLTFNKNDGVFNYEDFKGPKAALRITEFDTANPQQAIHRSVNETDPVAVLVSKDWWDARIAAYDAVDAAPLAFNMTEKTDDFLGDNLSLMIDLMRGDEQVTSRLKKTVNEGIDQKRMRTFRIIDTKTHFVDNSELLPEDEGQVGGNALAFLLHPVQRDNLAATPTATVYAGTGDGFIRPRLHHGFAIAETIDFVFTSGTAFTVTGSTTGAIGAGTVDVPFDFDQISGTIFAGPTPFVATDTFTVTSYATTF